MQTAVDSLASCPEQSTAAREPSEQRPMTVGGGPRAVKRAPSGVYRNSESRENTYEHIASGRARKQTYAIFPQVSSIPQAACRVEKLAKRRRVQPAPTTVQPALLGLPPAQRCGRCETMRINVCCTQAP